MNDQMRKYCELRAAGLTGANAVVSAGYSATSATATAARLDARKDVQELTRKLRKGGKSDTAVADDGREKILKDRYSSSLDLLQDLYNNPRAPMGVRVQAAKDALPYEHAKLGETGKKEKALEKAREKSATGGFGTRRSPGRPTPMKVN